MAFSVKETQDATRRFFKAIQAQKEQESQAKAQSCSENSGTTETDDYYNSFLERNAAHLEAFREQVRLWRYFTDEKWPQPNRKKLEKGVRRKCYLWP